MPYTLPQIPQIAEPLKTFRKVAWREVEREVSEFVASERDLFVQKIKRQQFRSFKIYPLSSSWLARKQAAGADQRVMIATKHYINSLKVMRVGTGRRSVSFKIGFEDKERAKDLEGNYTHVLLNTVAMVQEKGSAKMKLPPRSHWMPHLRSMRVRAAILRRDLVGLIRREVSRRVGPPFRAY